MKKPGEHFNVFNLSAELVGEMIVDGHKEIWPQDVHGWKHTLDCSVKPYSERSIAENIAFAEHIHKFNILMLQDPSD